MIKSRMIEYYRLVEYLREFAAERDWEQFHSPKNLSMALSVEAAELMECFQWLTEEQSYALDESTQAKVSDELADVQMYLVRLADQLHIDLDLAVQQKMLKNEQRFTVEKVKGSAKKIPADGA